MKLDRDRRPSRVLAPALLLSAAMAVTACGSAPSAPPVTAPAAPVVGTATLMAAELTDADEAPRVGKPQHSRADDAFDVELSEKDAPQRHAQRRGGGFSGYK